MSVGLISVHAFKKKKNVGHRLPFIIFESAHESSVLQYIFLCAAEPADIFIFYAEIFWWQ
jgi:hypothetical protein